jgi:glycosyltransferase involved in cell wall biosynthesis
VTAQPPLAAVGIWGEAAPGSRWANEGMQRLLGFLIEGAAAADLPVVWRVVVPSWLAAEAEADLRSLKAIPGVHWALHAPPPPATAEAPTPDAPPVGMDTSTEPAAVRELAAFANAEVPVDGWLVLFPFLTGATLLSARYAVILPDAIPFSYPVSWSPDYWGATGGWPLWRQWTARVIAKADTVITFSEHVKGEIAQRLFGLPAHRIMVAPHAQPDLRPHLSFLPPDGNRTILSRNTAATLLRNHAGARGWRHLTDFPFEHIDYVVVSTQDRQTKNVVAVVDAVAQLLRREALSLKLLMTTPIHVGATWTFLPGRIASDGLDLDVLSLPDLPRDVHAALYHGAAVAVHASFYEGGQAPFPFHEAVSLGTPCLIASGPHTEEFLGTADPQDFVFDPYDPLSLAIAIHAILSNRAAALSRQRAFIAAMPARGWGDVAADYASAALGSRLATRACMAGEFTA